MSYDHALWPSPLLPSGPGVGAGVQPPPVFDPRPIDELLAVMGDAGPGLVDHLVATYLRQSPRLLDTAAQAASAGQPDQLRRAADALKSSSAALGALRVAQLCRELEARARAGAPDLAALVQHARTEFDMVRPALEARTTAARH